MNQPATEERRCQFYGPYRRSSCLRPDCVHYHSRERTDHTGYVRNLLSRRLPGPHGEPGPGITSDPLQVFADADEIRQELHVACDEALSHYIRDPVNQERIAENINRALGLTPIDQVEVMPAPAPRSLVYPLKNPELSCRCRKWIDHAIPLGGSDWVTEDVIFCPWCGVRLKREMPEPIPQGKSRYEILRDSTAFKQA